MLQLQQYLSTQIKANQRIGLSLARKQNQHTSLGRNLKASYILVIWIKMFQTMIMEVCSKSLIRTIAIGENSLSPT